ncbi:MAG: response regulator transcription factor [Ornithinimicrobium sp.]
MSERPLRLVLLDDHRVFAEAIACRLAVEPDLQVVTLPGGTAELRTRLPQLDVDLVLLDLATAGHGAAKLVAEMARCRPGLGIVVIGDEDDEHLIVSVHNGARGWVPKSASVDDLLATLRGVARGETHIPASLLTQILRSLPVPAEAHPGVALLQRLTPREQQVLACLCRGQGRSEIAEELELSPNTIRTHVQSILGKLGVRSALAAVALIRQTGHPLLRQKT